MSGALPALAELAREAAVAFRLGAEADGSLQFARFIDGLGPALATPALAGQIVKLQPVLAAMLAAQARGDFIFLADLLEYELAPVL